MSQYTIPGIVPCDHCGGLVRVLPGRYWPYKRSVINAKPAEDGYLAIDLDRLDWRSTGWQERSLLAQMRQLYRFHECAKKGAA